MEFRSLKAEFENFGIEFNQIPLCPDLYRAVCKREGEEIYLMQVWKELDSETVAEPIAQQLRRALMNHQRQHLDTTYQDSTESEAVVQRTVLDSIINID